MEIYVEFLYIVTNNIFHINHTKITKVHKEEFKVFVRYLIVKLSSLICLHPFLPLPL